MPQTTESVDAGRFGRGGKGVRKGPTSAQARVARDTKADAQSVVDREFARTLSQHPLLAAALATAAKSKKPVTKEQAAAHGLTRRVFKDLLDGYKRMQRRKR
jgi:hypothetical protein